MSQNPFNVLGRALRHTSLGVLCWLEVIDLDPFVGFLFLAPHVCHFSFAEAVEAANKINATNFDFISCFEPTNCRTPDGRKAAHRLANAAHFLLLHAFCRDFGPPPLAVMCTLQRGVEL
jgi:hypothetical protein